MESPEPKYVIAIVPPKSVSDTLAASFAFDEIEPHITVKAQGGLDAKSKGEWLSSIEAALSGFGPVDVQLGAIGAFGNKVIYLEVDGLRLTALHRVLMDAVKPTGADVVRYFESKRWTPHLTLEQGKKLDLTSAQKIRASLANDAFRVSSVWLFRQGELGDRYVRDTEISLD